MLKKIPDVIERITINSKGFLHRKLKTKQYRPMKNFNEIKDFFINKKGIEIGGPSKIFSQKGFLPIYPIAQQIDGINFAASTVWTGDITQESGYAFNNTKLGEQFIFDASDLTLFDNGLYDFVLSSNNIEHLANPLKALEQWVSILKPGGSLVLIAPRKESNFDHNRAVVPFEHIVSDFENNIGENDLTHLDEIIELHDLAMDKAAGTIDQFRERSKNNIDNRCLHQHIFDLDVMEKMFAHFGLTISKKLALYSNYIVIGQKK